MTAASGGRIAKGAVWMVGARMADRLIGVISTVVLARLLTPADFGLVAMAMSVIGLIELASAFGFEITLLRTATPTRAQYDTVWTLNVLFGVGCGAAMALAALPTAHFYGDDRLIPIMFVLAAAWAIGSFGNVGIVDFQRTLNFAKEFQILMAKRLVGFTVTIGLAILTGSYWALIAGSVTARLTELVLSYLWHPYRPRFSLDASRGIFSFSSWIFVYKIAAFGNVRAADFVLGRARGAAELGIYRLGEEIGHLPGTELIAPLNRALLPGMSQMIEGGRPTKELVLAATGVVALVLFPACLGISAISEPLVRVMLGTKWLETVPVLQVMALNAAFVALWANQHTMLFAIGRPKLPALVSIARLLLFTPGVFLVVKDFGAQGVAYAALFSSVFALLVGLFTGLPLLHVRFIEYAGALWRPGVAAALMWAAVRWMVLTMQEARFLNLESLQLVVAVSGGVVVYGVAIAMLYLISGRPVGAEQLLIDRFAPKLQGWTRMPR